MTHLRKTVCILVVLCLVAGCFVMPANATDDPLAVKDYEEFGAPVVEEQEEAAVSEEVPVAEPEEPAAEPEKPAAEPEQPVAEPEKPAAVREEPVAEPEQPAAEPTEEPEVPETETTEPVAEAETAAAEEMEPAAEETAPEETVPEETVPETGQEPEEKEEDDFPLYFQTDYPDVRFGSGTVANNGCSITSLAMVATYMTGHEYKPDELARYFGGRAENNIARLEMGSKALQLPFEKAENWPEAYDALEEGKMIIVLVNNRGPFTQSQHFLVLKEINEAGKIVTYDSYEPNYDKWDLKQGFAEGFDPSVILQGYSGAWIYDVDAMPENPYIYYEPQPDRSQSRYPEVKLTLEQEDLLAKVIWVESRGECAAGQQAVAEVVLNRLVSNKFPNNLNDVIYGEGQFRSAKFLKDAAPSQAQYEAIEKALYGPNVLPMNVYYFATTPTTSRVWGGIGGHIFCYAEN